jgi:hypothetical protein
MHWNTRATLPQYYEMKLLADPPPKREFDYLSPEERRIYTIWLGAFRSVSKSWKAKSLSDATAASVKPLTNLMQE